MEDAQLQLIDVEKGGDWMWRVGRFEQHGRRQLKSTAIRAIDLEQRPCCALAISQCSLDLCGFEVYMMPARQRHSSSAVCQPAHIHKRPKQTKHTTGTVLRLDTHTHSLRPKFHLLGSCLLLHTHHTHTHTHLGPPLDHERRLVGVGQVANFNGVVLFKESAGGLAVVLW